MHLSGPYGDWVRWDALFADMEAQLAREHDQVVHAETADRSRAERATVSLMDRLVSQGDSPIELTLLDSSTVSGTPLDVAPAWLLVAATGTAAEHLVPTAAVVAFRGLGRRAGPEPGVVARRLGLGHALRALARDRALVEVRTTGGRFTGTIDGVGADHLDLAEHAADAMRRRREVRTVVTVAHSGLLSVRRVQDTERW